MSIDPFTSRFPLHTNKVRIGCTYESSPSKITMPQCHIPANTLFPALLATWYGATLYLPPSALHLPPGGCRDGRLEEFCQMRVHSSTAVGLLCPVIWSRLSPT